MCTLLLLVAQGHHLRIFLQRLNQRQTGHGKVSWRTSLSICCLGIQGLSNCQGTTTYGNAKKRNEFWNNVFVSNWYASPKHTRRSRVQQFSRFRGTYRKFPQLLSWACEWILIPHILSSAGTVLTCILYPKRCEQKHTSVQPCPQKSDHKSPMQNQLNMQT